MRLMAFPTEAVSVVPANVSIDHALAGLGDRYEHHFLAACRTTRENRWDAVRRYAYCRHVRTSLVPVCWGCPITTGGCKKSFGSGRGFFKLKLGHCEIQSRPQGVKTGQRPEVCHNRTAHGHLARQPCHQLRSFCLLYAAFRLNALLWNGGQHECRILVLNLDRYHCLWHLDCRWHDRRWLAFGLGAHGTAYRHCGFDQPLSSNSRSQNRVAGARASLRRRGGFCEPDRQSV